MESTQKTKRTRRILRIQSRICIGGPALNTINLSAGLKSKGYQTLLVGGRLQDNEKTMAPLAEEKGVDIQIIPEMGRSVSAWDDVKALIKLVKLIKKFKPHLVHTHTAKAGALGRLAAFLCRVPIRVHTFHGHVFDGYFNPWINRVVILLERFLALTSSRIIAISKIQVEDLTIRFRIVPKKKCRLVPLGFELDKVFGGERGHLRASLGLDDNHVLCGILARLVPVKNHSFLLDCIKEWKEKHQHKSTVKPIFLIIGDGDLREELEKKSVHSGIQDLVIFTGWRENLREIYADLDLNMLVSKNEGTPVTLIEGMASGVPILATDVGGIKDIAPQGTGTILSSQCTPSEFASALDRFLLNPVRLKQALQDKIREAFDVQRLVSDMDLVYQELFAEREKVSCKN